MAFPGQSAIGPPAFPGDAQWPAAGSSLTVARQRGILTRFPVPNQRSGRANQSTKTRYAAVVRAVNGEGNDWVIQKLTIEDLRLMIENH
jgi:hypothetical protein